MTILVIGASGQMGRSIAERIEARGVDAMVLGRPAIDISDPTRLAEVIDHVRPRAILNTAAFAQVDAAEKDRAEATALNANAPRTLAEAAERSGAALVHMSTDYVFDGSKGAPYSEDDTPNPINHYGRTKRAGEEAVLAHGGWVARVSWILSPYGSNFTKTMLRLARERDTVHVVDDQFGTPTLGLPLADALLDVSLAAIGSKGPRILHMAGRDGVAWADVAEAIFDASRRVGAPSARVERIPTSQRPTPAVRPLDTRLDSRALEDDFNIVLPDWKDGVQGVVDRLLSS